MARPRKDKEESLSNQISVRLDDKTKFGLSLLSKKHESKISALLFQYIKEMIDSRGYGLTTSVDTGNGVQPVNLLDVVWSANPVERFARQGVYCPEYLELNEQIHWKTIYKDDAYWVPGTDRVSLRGEALLNALDIKKVDDYLNNRG